MNVERGKRVVESLRALADLIPSEGSITVELSLREAGAAVAVMSAMASTNATLPDEGAVWMTVEKVLAALRALADSDG